MSKQKGDRNERKAVRIYEEAGYECETPNYSRFGNTDFFNLFDIMATNGEELIFIQVKSNSSAGVVEYFEAATELVPGDIGLHFLTHFDNEGFRLLVGGDERPEYTEEVDERESVGLIGDDLLAYLQNQ